MLVLRLLAISSLSYSTVTANVYSGKGDIFFTHYDLYPKSGLRVVYRPAKEKKYSSIGEGWLARISYHAYLSKHYAKKNYEKDVLGSRNGWELMLWESEGKYFYHEYKYGYLTLKSGFWFGYGVDIYNDDGGVIYEDINHFYEVPADIEYCQLDGDAYSHETKCSAVLKGLRSSKAGKIAAGIVVPLIVIAIVIGIVIWVKKGGAAALQRKLYLRTPADGPNTTRGQQNEVSMDRIPPQNSSTNSPTVSQQDCHPTPPKNETHYSEGGAYTNTAYAPPNQHLVTAQSSAASPPAGFKPAAPTPQPTTTKHLSTTDVTVDANVVKGLGSVIESGGDAISASAPDLDKM